MLEVRDSSEVDAVREGYLMHAPYNRGWRTVGPFGGPGAIV